MIYKFAVENFKGIGERVELDLSRLTLLFGPNSAGKSSILHALYYAREVFKDRNLDADRTFAGGDLVRLGGFKNFVHGRDLTREVKLAVEVDLEDEVLPGAHGTLGDWGDVTWAVLKEHETAEVELAIAWSSILERPYVRRYVVRLADDWILILEYAPDGSEGVLKFNAGHSSLLPGQPRRYLAGQVEEAGGADGPDWLPAAAQLRAAGLDLPTVQSLDDTASALLVAFAVAKDLGLLPIVIQDKIASIKLPTDESADPWRVVFPFSAEYLESNWNVHGHLAVAEQARGYDASGDMNSGGIPSHVTECASTINQFCDKLEATLRAIALWPYSYVEFYSVTSLGPLRTTPGRDYAPDETSPWASGFGAWAELYKYGEVFLDEVNAWLADPERLDTGYRLKKKHFREGAEHAIALQQRDSSQPDAKTTDERPAFPWPNEPDIKTDAAPPSAEPDPERASIRAAIEEYVRNIPERSLAQIDPMERDPHSRVVIVPVGSELELQPHDVGAGMSQLIPVVVLVLGGDETLVATIEQPELHLHPRLQAALGDLLIEGARRKKGFLIETHSEHLILRLQRRIREHLLSPDDVSVIYVKQGPNGAEATRLRLDEDGDFIDEWPGGFFPERLTELR